MSRIVASLTTLPSRISLIKETLDSIKNQTVRPDAIYLNIPKFCIKENALYIIPDFITNDNDKDIIVNVCEEDLGTCTKLFPTLEKETDLDTIIIIVDDDIVYSPLLFEKLISGLNRQPNTAVGLCGWDANILLAKGNYDFDLGYTKAPKTVSINSNTVLEHYAGVAYRRSFFDHRLFSLYAKIEKLYKSKGLTSTIPLDDITIAGYLYNKGINRGIAECNNVSLKEKDIGVNSIKEDNMAQKNKILIKVFQDLGVFITEEQTKKRILQTCLEFKPNIIYYDHDILTGDENVSRNRPGPYINKTIELLKIFKGKTVVEIGSMRSLPNTLDGEIDGASTQKWTDAGLEVYTCDIDPKCKKIIKQHYTTTPSNLTINIMDGIQFLKDLHKPIDLLFLDGWDKGTPNYAQKHLEAYNVAKDKLSKIHLICIDDTDFNTPNGGKDKYLAPKLIQDGYIKIISGRQTVFLKY